MIFAAAQKTVTHGGPSTFHFHPLIISPTKHSYPHIFGYEIATPTYRVCYRYIGNIGFIGGSRKIYLHQHKPSRGRDSTHEEECGWCHKNPRRLWINHEAAGAGIFFRIAVEDLG